ncbi:MAG: ABC transporter permease [Stappia sp.]|uniref:AEC family transporter n=1 Tax=Stappia sp. TaxID=1870903 RepID=UPI000C5517AD|nr:AEC family transporter [Stappia sp.]MAB00993.1 ABC transporter permease [Stappia sp.]MBM20128.1 ABC transporter permease [Stappia sp.]
MVLQILTIVLPLFILIGLGYAAARTGVLEASIGDGLGRFVYVVAIPVMIFRTLATSDLGGVSPWGFWFSYFTGVAITWTLGTLLIGHVFRREARAGVIGGINAAFANTALVGVPLVTAVHGEAGLVPLFILISIHLPVMTVACALLMERAAVLDGTQEPQPLPKLVTGVLKNLATNPIVIGIACGVAWRFTGLPIEGVFSEVLSRIASATIPVALFSLGMSMVSYGIRGNLAPGLVLSTLKIGVMPAIVFIMARYVVHMPPLWISVATLTAACPTGINAFLFANRYGTGHAMSANSITLTTGLAVVTTGLWMLFLAG